MVPEIRGEPGRRSSPAKTWAPGVGRRRRRWRRRRKSHARVSGSWVNGLLGEAYWTIHITPEAHCSYVSFETNVSPSAFNKKTAPEFYSWLIANVAKVFKPGRMTVTLFADDHVPQMCQLRKTSSCFDEAIRKISGRYSLKSKSMYEFDGSSVTLCNLSKIPKKVEKKPKQPAITLQTLAKELGITIDDAPKEKTKLKKKASTQNQIVKENLTQVVGH